MSAFVAACPQCGSIVDAQPRPSVGWGIALGLVAAVAATIVWGLLALLFFSHSSMEPQACRAVWLARGFVLVTIALCLTAFVAGVRAARRGAAGLSMVFFIPAVTVLWPATTCTVGVFSSC